MSDSSAAPAPAGTWEYSPAPETVKVAVPERTQLYVGGAFVDPRSEKHFDTVNPATEAVLSRIAEADAQDVDAAVAAARKAFKGWSRLPATERAKYL